MLTKAIALLLHNETEQHQATAFTQTTTYKVVAKDILDPTAVEEMTAGDYDLTLFTCTYGGENRVTIRCDHVSGE